jgi:hypothetical protein
MTPVVQARCPGCRKVLRIPAAWVDQPVRCRHCGMVLHARPKAPQHVAAAAPAAGNAFEDLDAPDEGAPETRRRRRRAAAWLAMAAALGLLLFTGAGAAFLLVTHPDLLSPRAADGGGDPARAADDRPAPEAAAEVREAPKGTLFPRRALVISVNHYLYANPVDPGPVEEVRRTGGPLARLPAGRGGPKGRPAERRPAEPPPAPTRTVRALGHKLSGGLHVPNDQTALLSDAAPAALARPPLKAVIEKTLTDFLAGSRAQDRLLVFFAGHAVEAEGEAYLVPLEGELDKPATLLPLKWVYEQLAKCPARQKVLVLDVCRFNPTLGAERPGGDPMGEKLAAAIKQPPPGVQVWASCSAGQQSVGTDDEPVGVFLAALSGVLEKAGEGRLKLQDRIQRPDDLLPLEKMAEAVNKAMADELKSLKLTQVSFLAGQPTPEGASYNPAEPAPPQPTLAAAPSPGPARQEELLRYLADVRTPPVKPSQGGDPGLNFAFLPPFRPEVMDAYADDGKGETELRKAVRKAQVLLYAVSTTRPPPELQDEVDEAHKELKVNLSVMRDGYRVPVSENEFKNGVRRDQERVTHLMARLGDALEELENAAGARGAEPKRWQANYDLMVARVKEEIAYLYEYQSMLGQIRKELPPRDPERQGGWRLASRPELSGDAAGRKLAKDARKLLDKVAREHAGTPWEVLAKREQLTALGLEWKPVR